MNHLEASIKLISNPILLQSFYSKALFDVQTREEMSEFEKEITPNKWYKFINCNYEPKSCINHFDIWYQQKRIFMVTLSYSSLGCEHMQKSFNSTYQTSYFQFTHSHDLNTCRIQARGLKKINDLLKLLLINNHFTPKALEKMHSLLNEISKDKII